MDEVQYNTHHLRLAPGAAIDILHLLIRCVRKEMKKQEFLLSSHTEP